MDQLSFVFVVVFVVSAALAAPSDKMTVKMRQECKKLPGPPAQLGHCCKFPQLNFDEYALACMKEIPWDIANPLMSACRMHECHFKKANFMHAKSRKINKKALIDFTKKAFVNQTTWIDNGVKAFDMCIDHAALYVDDIRMTFDAHSFDLDKCDPMFMSVETCAFMYLFRNCPAESWTENEMCKGWKEHLDLCHAEEEMILMLNNVTVEQLREEGVIV